MSKTISFSIFSKKEVDKAIEELKKYKEELNEKIDLFVKTLAEKGVEMAKEKLAIYDKVYTGELQNSIELKAGDVIKNDACYYIYTGCKYASFVEFGTGVTGEGTYAHNMPEDISWEYASGQHIFTRENGETGWYYKNENDGKVRFTTGEPSYPFMTETAIMLSMQVLEVAKEVFGGASDL